MLTADALKGYWELIILDADPPTSDMGSLAVGDVDGDGRMEILIGGREAILWYRPETFEKGRVSDDSTHVGLEVHDVDGDGLPEVVVGLNFPKPQIGWFKPTGSLHEPWARHLVDANPQGGAHDLAFADLDGDGRDELIANAVGQNPGLFIYKAGDDPTAPWQRHAIQTGGFEEGIAVGDLDGDGRLEVVSGPNWYHMPSGGPFAGPWQRHDLAVSHREMNRVALADVTGSGRPDVVMVDSEYFDGQLSWFENRLGAGDGKPWIEHRMETGLIYAHTLHAERDAEKGEVIVLVGEMAEGGWNAPRNRDARLIGYASADGGASWKRTVLVHGTGTHEADLADVDGDGRIEIAGKEWRRPKVQLWKRRDTPSPLLSYRHRFLDRDKPETGIEILAADVDGDGRADVLCGSWWYRNPTWERHAIPGIGQVICAYDLDGDGRQELIATKRKGDKQGYGGLSSELVWLKPVDPAAGRWEEHEIGTGTGDWPHGAGVAPVGAGGKPALVVGYHSADREGHHFPEIFEFDGDPAAGPWTRRVIAEIAYGEEIVACDVNGDGRMDLVAGQHWIENLGGGRFEAHAITEGFHAARVCVCDVTGNGRPDVILGEEVLDFQNKVTPLSRLVWFESPVDPVAGTWTPHVIDKVRCPHSVSVADLDGDGQMEIVCGEHDPFYPYRNRCRLLVYKKADPAGRAWSCHVLDARFEHHDGARIIELEPGRLGIISHGWKDARYVHLWEPAAEAGR